MAGVNGDRKGKKDDNGIGTAIDFMLSNAKLVLGVGGAAMLGIATLAVKRVGSHLPTFLYTSPLPCTVLLLKHPSPPEQYAHSSSLCRCMTAP